MADWRTDMIKLTKKQEQELRNFIINTGNNYNLKATPLPIDGTLSGFTTEDTHHILPHKGPSLSYNVSLNPLFVEEHYDMTIEDTNTFEELKDCVEKTIFEMAAYRHLYTFLNTFSVLFVFKTNKDNCKIDCEIESPCLANYQILIDYHNDCDAHITVNEDELLVSYKIEGNDIQQVRELIRTTVIQLIEENKIYNMFNKKPSCIEALTVKDLYEECKNQIAKGNGDKLVLLSSDDEGNLYHTLYYSFTDDVDEIEACMFDSTKSAEEIVLLG